MADQAERCAARWDDLQFELVAGHNCAHAALVTGALMSWANSDADDPVSINLQWADQPS
jgi:hypothetical protein